MISNDEFCRAYDDRRNAEMMRALLNRYRIHDESARVEIMENAVLKTLKRHDEKIQRFRSSLYKYVMWECREYLKVRKREESRRDRGVDPDWTQAKPSPHSGRLGHVLECMGQIPEEEARVVGQYYFENRTLREIGEANGCSHESARVLLKNGIERLKTICLKGE